MLEIKNLNPFKFTIKCMIYSMEKYNLSFRYEKEWIYNYETKNFDNLTFTL